MNRTAERANECAALLMGEYHIADFMAGYNAIVADWNPADDLNHLAEFLRSKAVRCFPPEKVRGEWPGIANIWWGAMESPEDALFAALDAIQPGWDE